MEKITNTYVLCISKDRNGKQHFYVCENMEVAKRYFYSDVSKQFVTFIKDDLTNSNINDIIDISRKGDN